MDNDKKHPKSPFYRDVNGVRQNVNIEVVNDFTIEHTNGDFLSVWEILQGWDRARIHALSESCQVSSVILGRFRVWVREGVDSSSRSVIIQCDLHEGVSMEPLAGEEPEPSPDKGTVEVAGIDFPVG